MDNDATQPSQLSPGVLWTLRALAIAGLAVALFLLGIDIAWMIKQQTTKVPFCSAFMWLDCEAVLSHPRWSYVLGLPVSVPAVGLYIVMLAMLFVVSPRRSEKSNRIAWWWLSLGGGAIAIAAGWFIYLQLGVLGKICQYCMIEHVVGLTFAVLIVVHGFRLQRLSSPAMLIGAAAAGGMITLQLLATPAATRSIVIDPVTKGEPYLETGPDIQAVPLAEGQVTLNTSQHPMVGSPAAKHVIVEVLDYTCPRCRLAYEKLEKVMPLLGDDYALLVVTFPINTQCNPHVEYDDPRHADACFLAKLAHALWITDPSQSEALHHFLFRNQKQMTRDMALDKARELVGMRHLEGHRIDPRVDKLLKRDVDLVNRLGLNRLPGLILRDKVMTYLGDEPERLAEKIREAFESSQATGP